MRFVAMWLAIAVLDSWTAEAMSRLRGRGGSDQATDSTDGRRTFFPDEGSRHLLTDSVTGKYDHGDGTTYGTSAFRRIGIMVAPRIARHSVVATSAGNLAFSASVRSHRIFTDQTVRSGGNDSAPTPIELLTAALASCVALHVLQFCEGKGFDAQDLAVEVKPLWRDNPGRIARFDIVLHIPDTIPGTFRDAIDEVVRGCPVYQTFLHGPTVECRQVTGTPVLGAA